MHVLLVSAPPSSASLTARLLAAAADELRHLGHTTEVVDVVARGWDPVVRASDYGVEQMDGPVGAHAVDAISAGSLAPEVLEQQRAMREADLIVLLFPLWWFGMPAALKGWVDRVFTQGFAYGIKDEQGRTRKYGDGAFAGTRGLVIVTTGDRPSAFGPRGLNGDIRDVLFPIAHGVFWYTGIAALEPLALLGVDAPGWEGADAAEATVRARMATVATDTPISYRRMLDDYDQQRVLRAVAERRLELEDSVDRWLPGLLTGHGRDGTAVTVRHLLAHTSGVPNYSVDAALLAADTGAAFLAHRHDVFAPEDLVAAAMAHPPAFSPGSDWQYSNTNYIVAGMVVERVTGQRLDEVLAERISVPLGLTRTELPRDERLRTPHARNYTTALVPGPDAPVYDATSLHPSKAWAAGGMLSTLSDLNRFFAALFAGRLLPEEQQRALLTIRSTADRGWIPKTEYGLGIYSQSLTDGTVVWGGGGAITGSWTLSIGSKDGSHRLSANLNADWGNVLRIFVRLADFEFSAQTTGDRDVRASA